MANTTFTIRLPVPLRAKLRRKAKALGITESEFARNLMSNGLDEHNRAEKLAKLAGSLSFDDAKLDPFQQHIKDMNWRA